MAVSFISGGNWSTRRKPPSCRKPSTNFITKCCIEYTSPLVAFQLTTLVMIGTKLPNYQVGVDDKLKYKTVHYQIWPS